MDEKQRIKEVLQGNVASFSYFVDAYQDMAITMAFRISNNMQDAEDIVQDAFVKAYNNLHTFRSDSKFSTWFYRIVYNTAISQIQSSFYKTEYSDYTEAEKAVDSFSIIEELETQEKKEFINKALGKIPQDLSLILTLFYLNENSIKEITLITGLSESNVKVKLFRARKQIESAMGSLLKGNNIDIIDIKYAKERI